MTSLEDFKRAIRDRAFVQDSGGVRIIENEEYRTPWLFDFRAILLDPEWLDTYAEIFWERHKHLYPFQVCGMETAAIALVSAVVMKGTERGTPVNGLFIRKSRKRTGLMKQLEGTPTTDPVILVDDLINSGTTFNKQIVVLEDAHLSVAALFAIVSFRASETYSFASKRNIPITTLFSLLDFGIRPLPTQLPTTPSDSFDVLWRFRAPNPSFNIVVQKSAPVTDGERVYFGSDSGTFYALDTVDGFIVWKYETGKHPEGKGVLSSPAMHNGTVYFGAYDGTVYALDAKSGERKWSYSDADWVGSSPAIAATDNLLFIGLEFGLVRKRGGIVALNLATGEPEWSHTTPYLTHGSPLYIENEQLVVIGSNDNTIYAYRARSGELVWTYRADGDTKSSFAYDPKTRRIFFGTLGGTIFALNASDGNVAYAREIGPVYSTPLVHDNIVYIASLDKHLYAFDAETGLERACFATNGRIFASPVYADTAIWIGSNDGRLYELSPDTLTIRGSLQLSERIVTKVVFDSVRGHLFVATVANEMYCLKRAVVSA